MTTLRGSSVASEPASAGSGSPEVGGPSTRIGSGPPGVQRGWFLEDAVPGGTLHHPGGRTLDEADHVWLAWISQNASDVHGNADAASRSPWGQPIVLGALTVAIVIGLAAPGVPEPALGATGALDGWLSIRLTATVLPGDTVRAESTIHAVTAAPGAPTGRVRRTIRGVNQRGEVVAEIEEEREVARRAAG